MAPLAPAAKLAAIALNEKPRRPVRDGGALGIASAAAPLRGWG